MFAESGETTRLFFHALSSAMLIVGVTVDLCLLGLVQIRRLTPALPAAARVAGGPFAAFHTQLALAVTFLFALLAALQPPDAAPPQDGAFVQGTLIYAATAGLVVVCGLVYSRITFRKAFLSPRGTTGHAVKMGFLYGAAALPPVVGLSMGVSAALDGLGYLPQHQEAFEWLNAAQSPGARLFMLAAVVVVAPVVEELLFRGILFAAVLKTRRFAFAALLSGAYFALAHLHAPSFLPLLALSAAFAAGYATTGSIVTPIIMHALFNFTSLLFYFAAPP
jgi:membrane protease YdiL (CAAX protease family)